MNPFVASSNAFIRAYTEAQDKSNHAILSGSIMVHCSGAMQQFFFTFPENYVWNYNTLEQAKVLFSNNITSLKPKEYPANSFYVVGVTWSMSIPFEQIQLAEKKMEEDEKRRTEEILQKPLPTFSEVFHTSNLNPVQPDDSMRE